MNASAKLSGEKHELRIEDEWGSYPEALRSLDEPPKKVFCIGDADLLEIPSIAITGCRRATEYGLSCAERFAGLAANRGAAVITGGARGIETAAIRASLDAGAACIVFLAGGCDYAYPEENASLFQEVIMSGGCVASACNWGASARPWHFKKRQEYVVALSKALLVCEAGLPSGSFSCADRSLSLGKDVFAVPGAITSEASAGSNNLIMQGAFPVVDDSSFLAALDALGFHRMCA